MGIHQTSSNFNTKLILWQLDRLQREPLEGVNAAPLECDLFTWHGNFYWPEDHKDFPNLTVHFVLTLPRDFPNSTPHMELLTRFRHSHVFGGSICFSLLKEFEDHFRGLPDTVFWNPARSIRSLLESVYVFLTVDEDAWCTISKQEGLDTVRRAQQVRCAECGHGPDKVFPPEEQWLAARASSNTNNDTEQQVCALAMHQDLTETDPKRKKKLPTVPRPPLQSVQYKSKYAVTEISAATTAAGVPLNLRADGNDGSTCFDDRAAVLKAEANQALSVTDHNLLSREATEDFKCSVSGVSFDHSPNVVLGFGVNVVRRARDGSIESITSDLVPLSMDIFYKGRIRKSALGATLTHFFPFAINEHHWKRARRVLPGCVGAILGEPERKLAKTWEDRLLFVVGELWKSMAVLMMQGGAHASEKVLKGFCALHHILLLSTEETDATLSNKPMVMAAAAAASSKPAPPNTAAKEDNGAAQEDSGEAKTWTMVVRSGTRAKAASAQRESSRSGLKALADTRVQNFVRYPRMRHKAQCPDFGRFLPLILLSSVAWDDVKAPFLQELLTRNARWICKAQRSLALVKPQERQTLSNRAKQSWAASATGLKLTAFQVRFALSVAPWAKEALPEEVVAVYERARQPQLMVRAMYNLLGGRPTPAMLCRFQEETKRIESLTSFEGFFATVNMHVSEMEIQQMLCDAMEKSERFGYHRL